jgi:hypothetical protein
VVAVALLLLSASGSAAIERALSWLPQDTEVVVAATVPGKIEQSGKSPNLADAVKYLASIGLPNGRGVLDELNYTFILDGSRNFLPPKDLGLETYDGCKIVGVTAAESQRFRQKLNQIKTAKQTTIAGHAAYVLQERSQADVWTYSIVLEGELLFIATEKRFLTEVLTRRAGPARGRALPDSLSVWKTIDRSQPFWAVRQFPTASKKMGYGLNMGDPGLIGYGLALDKDLRRLILTSRSTSSNGFGRANDTFGGFFRSEQKPGLRAIEAVAPGVTRITFDGQETDSEAVIFILMAALGRAVYV